MLPRAFSFCLCLRVKGVKRCKQVGGPSAEEGLCRVVHLGECKEYKSYEFSGSKQVVLLSDEQFLV